MADEDHILRNAIGNVVGVTCTKCGRIMDGDSPRQCADCSSDSRSSSRASTSSAKADE